MRKTEVEGEINRAVQLQKNNKKTTTKEKREVKRSVEKFISRRKASGNRIERRVNHDITGGGQF